MKEVFLYSGFYDWTIETLIVAMQEMHKEDDLTIRMNSGGGCAFAGQGLWAEMQKRRDNGKKTTLSVDGNASSMGFYSMLFADKVTILDTTKCLIHRADMYVESEEDQKMLNEINDKFKNSLLTRVTSERFQQITGYTIEQLFAKDTRLELWLSSQDLVDLNIVKKEDVLVLSPVQIAANNKKVLALMSDYKEKEPKINILNLNNNNMTEQEIHASNAKAVEAEKSRVAGWMVWANVDLTKVAAGIESGKEISAKDTQEFILASTNKLALDNIAKTSNPVVNVPSKDLTSEQVAEQEYKQAEKELLAKLGVKQLEG